MSAETAAPVLPEIAPSTPIVTSEIEETAAQVVVVEGQAAAVAEKTDVVVAETVAVEAVVSEEKKEEVAAAAEPATPAKVEEVADVVSEKVEVKVIEKGMLKVGGILGIPVKRFAVLGKEEDTIVLDRLLLVHKKSFKPSEAATTPRNSRVLIDIATATVTTRGLLVLYKSESSLEEPLSILNLRELKEVNSVGSTLNVLLESNTFQFTAGSSAEAGRWVEAIKAVGEDVKGHSVEDHETYKASLEKLSK
ncbi:hypothetical protein HK101_006216 [Irineochytrium annulatum]|nr:hypothetical protein HK101_006216 [Irineochytrium annulatum]